MPSTSRHRTPARLVFFALLASSGLGLWGCEDEDGGFVGCQTDNDCKNDRVCTQGTCQAPGGQTSGDETTSAEPTTGSSNGEGSESESASDPTDPTDPTDSSATTASTSGPSGSDSDTTGGTPLQPYGKCVFECSTDADCCEEYFCNGDTHYVCDEGLCRGECMPSCESSTLGNFSWTCVTNQIAPADSTYCGIPCEGNTCSNIGDDFTCIPDGAYEPDVCGAACSQPGVSCSGASNGAACLPNGDCGCYGDGDCSPGYTCFRAWE